MSRPPIRLIEQPTWISRLLRGEKGILPTVSNVMLILGNDPALDGLLAYDAFTHQPLLMLPVPPAEENAPTLPGPYPRQWECADITLVHAYLQRVWSPSIRRETTENAMITEATMRQFHPIRTWLKTLVWDRKPRINNWLINAFDCEQTAFHRAVGAKVLIAGVRRVMRPGCKFDQMLVLEGAQGIGKSRALQALAGDAWFSDVIPPDLTSKDAAMSLVGVWILEFAEIEHLIRMEVETIKAFLSRAVDRYRPPYGKTYVERPRQGIPVGTTNSDDYLRDSTGNRRIWPVKCRCADPEWVALNRDQLWAEAVVREAGGEPIWIDDQDTQSQAIDAAAGRMAEDVWQEKIREWLLLQVETTAADVLQHGLGMTPDKMTRAADMRVGATLRVLGWGPAVIKVDGKSKRVWRLQPPSTTIHENGDFGF